MTKELANWLWNAIDQVYKFVRWLPYIAATVFAYRTMDVPIFLYFSYAMCFILSLWCFLAVYALCSANMPRYSALPIWQKALLIGTAISVSAVISYIFLMMIGISVRSLTQLLLGGGAAAI